MAKATLNSIKPGDKIPVKGSGNPGQGGARLTPQEQWRLNQAQGKSNDWQGNPDISTLPNTYPLHIKPGDPMWANIPSGIGGIYDHPPQSQGPLRPGQNGVENLNIADPAEVEHFRGTQMNHFIKPDANNPEMGGGPQSMQGINSNKGTSLADLLKYLNAKGIKPIPV